MRSRVSSACYRTAALGLALVVATVATTAPSFASAPLIPISGLSPYSDGGDPNNPSTVTACNGGPQIGVVYRNSETEPYIAVNPTDPDNMIACWHQDRWSNGSGQGVGCGFSMDGGDTWTQVIIPFTRCSGAGPGDEVEFERASDPWLTFNGDGSCYYMALVSDESTPRNGMAVAKSTDGGQTWSQPTIIAIHDPRRGPSDDSVARTGSRPSLAVPHESLTSWVSEKVKRRWLRQRDIPTTGEPMRSSGDDDDGGNGNPGKFVFHDKNSITADPFDSDFVYATWTLFIDDETELVFSRSEDGGETWSNFRNIGRFKRVDKNTEVFFRQGAQIVVLPDGTLLNTFFRILLNRRTQDFVAVDQAIFRSFDKGKKWEKVETQVATFESTGGIDAEKLIIEGVFIPVRDASNLPDIAVNRNTGDIYMVWQDGSFREFGASSIVISRSTDGGSTWSSPVPVHDVADPPGFPGQSFLPAVAVADDGTVGVLFYDFRNDVFFDGPLDTDVFMSLMTPDLSRIAEIRVTDESFDMRQMVITGDRGYFPGDYIGLDAAEDDFVAAFTVANNLDLPVDFPQDNTVLRVDSNNRQDIVFARVPSTPAIASADRPGDETKPLLAQKAQTSGYALHTATPNPFNPSTSIAFELGEASAVRLEIFDVTGRRVRSLVNGEHLAAGPHQVTWDGRAENGRQAATGVYLYRLMTKGFTETRRMVLMK